MTRLQRLDFLLKALQGLGRIDAKDKVIYMPYDVQLSPVNAHDISELKRFYKFRIQYEITQ
jgi:hypothetical protein